MKFAILLSASLLTSAYAANDSVAFFYNPEKVVVLINERNLSGRLDRFMRHFGNSDVLATSSSDNSIAINCNRARLGIGCSFKFKPSNTVRIQNRSLKVDTSAKFLNLPDVGVFQMNFASSMKDKFEFVMLENGSIRMTGSKILEN